MLDRTLPPPLHEMESLTFPSVAKHVLPNGISLYVIDRGTQEISRVDVLFSAGKIDDAHRLTAELTAAMLREGAAGMTSADIAERLDYYGATLQTMSTLRNTYFTLYSANRYFAELLPLLHRIITSPTFPEKEFQTVKERGLQSLRVELEKVDVLASRAFSAQLFGSKHPYGSSTEPADYETLTIERLRAFHLAYYTAQRCRIVLSGRITDEMIALVEKLFSDMPAGEAPLFVAPPFRSAEEHYRLVEKSGVLQSGIRAGLFVVGRDHPDHHCLRILNTVLGGYFGSRLMSKIREEKGYTYGIHSTVVTFPDVAYLTIQTQAATAYVRPLLDDLFAELRRLREEPVGEDELFMVRNYMMGEMLRLFDTPISVAEVFVTLLANNLDFDYYAARFDAVRVVTAEQLFDVARRRLDEKAFYVTVAGQDKSC